MKKAKFVLLAGMVAVVLGFVLESRCEFNADKRRERDEQRLADIGAIRSALEKYYQDNNAYPAGNGLILGGTTANYLSSVGFSDRGSAVGTSYLDTVRKDPKYGRAYIYTQLDEGKSYQIEFEIEGPTVGYPQPGKYTSVGIH